MQSDDSNPRRPLRPWLGVVAVVLQWLVRFGLPAAGESVAECCRPPYARRPMRLCLALLVPLLAGSPGGAREHEALVTETYSNLQPVAGSDVPVTFSRVGCVGDFTDGITPIVDGRALPAQVDVLARNDDGSVRHALVSFVLPSVPEAGPIRVGYANAAPPQPAPFEWPEDGTPSELVLELTDESGRTWTSVAALDTASGTSPVAGARALVDGPVMKEFELHDVPSSEGERHPTLDVFWRLRLYTGERSMRVHAIVETTRLDTARPRARLSFEGLKLRYGDVALLERGPFEQLDRTRYRLQAWTEGPLERIHRRPNVAYLERGMFIPPYRPAGERIDVAAAERAYHVSPGRLHPLMPGVIHEHMGGTGDRPDIGPYPGWALSYLYSGSPRLYRVLLHADGNGGGAFPMHVRRAPDTPGVRYIADRRALEARQKVRLPPRHETASKVAPDRSHAPSLGYFGYLLTGDRFYAEELSFWASYQLAGWPWKGIELDMQERVQAWGLRHVVDAAFLLPDEHPLKPYFAREVNAYARKVARVAEDSGRPLHWLRDAGRQSGRPHWVNCRHTSPWQYAWVVWSLGNAVDKGFASAELPRNWTAEYLVGLYTSQDEFLGPDGETYRFDPQDAMQYSLATSLHEYSTYQKKGQTLTALGERLTDFGSYAEMWYWTKVNADNCYSDSHGFRDRSGSDGLLPLRDPGWGHGRNASGAKAYNWNRYGAWVGLVSTVNGEVEGAAEAWEVMVRLAGPGSQHGFNMLPRAHAGEPVTADEP